jgi:hypothetical protein
MGPWRTEGSKENVMAAKPKRPGRSFFDERQLIALAKTMKLDAIVKKTGRKPKAVLNMAKRLGVSLNAAGRTIVNKR